MDQGSNRRHQLNVTLDQRHADILETIGYLDESSEAEIAQRLLERYLDQRSEDASVERVMALRKEARAARDARSRRVDS